ncbi:hypothetical protein [Oceaniferula flava]|uniref:hypothetical protein n=1 Tax=Oceaniferula flava TaxID=2800421 RepID=UPI002867E1F5|nr:hypothetical protein [Oceaniferula flavus]
MIGNRAADKLATEALERKKEKLKNYCSNLPAEKQKLVSCHFPELIAHQSHEPLDDLVESIRAAEFEEKGASQ